jgi:hypothetical protein
MHKDFRDCVLPILDSISNNAKRRRFLEFCGHEYKLLNFLHLYYTNLNSNPYLFYLIILIGLPYIIFFLRHLCEQHIAHLIPELAEKLGMTKNLSAIILISFAISFNNFLYVIHSEETDHGIECLESAFILLCLFLSMALVIPCCVLRSSEVKVRIKKVDFLKEVVMILIALLFILSYSILG